MTGSVLVGLVFIGGVLVAVLGELINEEIRGWIDYLPRVILQLVARRLDPAGKITIYEDEWLPELTCILRGADARPISRVILGVKYSAGLLIKARRIASHLHRETAQASLTPGLTAPEVAVQASRLMRFQALLERENAVSMTQAAIAAEIEETQHELDCAEYLESELAPGSKARMEARYLRHCHQQRLASLGEHLRVASRDLITLTAERAEALSHLEAPQLIPECVTQAWEKLSRETRTPRR
jgi:hypothetical protein